MEQCPKCKSDDVHHSRAKSRWESWRKRITNRRPYRCRACGWRGWGVDVGPAYDPKDAELAARAMAPEPPNLTGIVLAREKRSPSEVNLKALDPI